MSNDLVKRLRLMLEGDLRPSPLGRRAADRIEAPERIWMDPDIKFPECEKQYGCDIEYIRKDVSDALVAAAYDKGIRDDPVNYYPPKDAIAALDRIKQETREEALREALDAARGYRYRRGEAVENAILALIAKEKTNG